MNPRGRPGTIGRMARRRRDQPADQQLGSVLTYFGRRHQLATVAVLFIMAGVALLFYWDQQRRLQPLLEHHLRMHRHLGIERTLVVGEAKAGLVRSWLADCCD